jgi:hypothetical protein
MSIAPFTPHPVPMRSDAEGGWWRTRLAVASATIGIAATLFAYAISPGLRHAVSHAEHSVTHAVSRVFDRDAAARKHAPSIAARKHPSKSTSRTGKPAAATKH